MPLRSKLTAVVRSVRERRLHAGPPAKLEDAYTICYFLGRRLRHKHPDVRIMVGDYNGPRGPIMHHWLEIPSRRMYIDAAFDRFEPARPLRAGRTTDTSYISDYLNALDSRFDLNDPRNDPKLVYRDRQAWDSEVP
jgi:hypothetical protein